jgi:hypothetical protein
MGLGKLKIIGVALVAGAVVVTGCQTTGGGNNSSNKNAYNTSEVEPPLSQPSFSRFPDLPMPVKGLLDMSETVVVGASDKWVGRIKLITPYQSLDMFDFYLQEMPGFGWQEIKVVRSRASVMTYERNKRFATIEIANANGSSEITIIVEPLSVINQPVQQQLTDLNKLLEKGLITKSEAVSKRKEILDGM